jgi:hypothetical protein
VPQRWAEDPPLGRWVNSHRSRKKALDRGEPSDGMTAERVAKLEALGFRWAKAMEAKGTSSSFRGVCRKKSEGKWIKEEAKRKSKAKAKKNARNAKKKNAKRKSPTITRAKAEEDRKAKRKAKAKTKKNTKRQRIVAIQTRWRFSAL